MDQINSDRSDKNGDVARERVQIWLSLASADAERRGLPELKPILQMFARATGALRAADWNSLERPDD
jgi:hypothetical protein